MASMAHGQGEESKALTGAVLKRHMHGGMMLQQYYYTSAMLGPGPAEW
jgi:hypothetical protein